MDKKQIKVLLIEDNPGDVRLIREMLRDAGATQFELEHADQLSSGLERLAERKFDLLLLDLGLPDSQGLYTLTETIAQAPELPIVVLTGLADEMAGIKAVQEGAQDYLLKGQLSGSLLMRAMRYALERKRMEDEQHKINRSLKVLSECNQMLVRATEESELLHKICRIIVEIGGYHFAWVGYAEHDEKKTVRPVAYAGREEGYLETACITWADDERGRGPTGMAIRAGKFFICKNILADPNYAPWRDNAIKRGYSSSIALPLIANDQIFGALNIYASEPDAFDTEEVKLLMELADDLAYGIMTIRTRIAHKQIDDALRESENRYHALFENSPVSLWEEDFSEVKSFIDCLRDSGVTDLKKYIENNPEVVVQCAARVKIIDVNKATLDLYQAESKEHVQRGLNQIFGKKAYDIFQEELITLAGGATTFETEATTYTLHGSKNHIVLRLTIAPGFEKTWSKVFVSIIDVTKRKQAENEIRLLLILTQDISESTDFRTAMQVVLRRVCESTGWVYGESWIPSPDGSCLISCPSWYNSIDSLEEFRKASEEFKYPPDIGLPGRVWSSKKPLWVRDVMLDTNFTRLQIARNAGIKAGMAIPVLAGHEVVSVMTFFLLETREEDEKMVELASSVAAQLGTLFLRKRTEETLRESEERFRQLAENIKDVFWMHDPEMNQILYVSPAYEEIWGRTCESLRASPGSWLEAVHTEDRERVLREASTKLIYGEYDVEYRIMRPDGSMRWIRDIAFPVQNASGEVYRVVGIAEDITDHKKLEDQLRHAQKMEVVGQLAGGIAHDFNNILTVIIGFATLLQKKIGENSPLNDDLNHILTAAERAANLTRSLLAFGRKQVINLRPVNLNDIISGIEKLLSRLLREDIELKTILAKEDLIAIADSEQIEQVLINLVTNARDAIPDGGQLIIETCRVKLDNEFIRAHGYGVPGMYALISVTDTGVGMDEKTIKRIFEPFFTTKEVGKGTGLGLSIVYGIIKQHNGYINAYSEVGKGTVFKIYLPLTEFKAKDAELTQFTIPKGGIETVLLAEDDADVRRLTKTTLKEFGYKVIEAVDGEDAVEKFVEKKERIQLLILDVIMPKKNGKEVLDVIRKISPNIKALFMSGYPAQIIQNKEILEKRLSFVSKPISPIEFLKKVREVLDT